jgi:hypothetical protein
VAEVVTRLRGLEPAGARTIGDGQRLLEVATAKEEALPIWCGRNNG